MAETLFLIIVQRIGSFLFTKTATNVRVFFEVDSKVNSLHVELRRMQCFVKDADLRHDIDETIRNWVAEVREAAYDAEDIIEIFNLRILSKRRARTVFVSKIFGNLFQDRRTLKEVVSKVDAILANLSNLSNSLNTYGITKLTEREGGSSSRDRLREQRRPFPHVDEPHVIGVEENIRDLVSHLVTDEKHLRVVSICGMGGLGKTTLAKKVYNRSEVRRHFDGFAWVYVSQQCQRRDVWEAIIVNLIPSPNHRHKILKSRDEELAQKLHQILRERKCLVILDDIWAVRDWDSLKCAFPTNNDETGSKILLTSRNKEVASWADPRGFLLEPQCLNDNDSWELFQRIAFSKRANADITMNAKMEELGRKIVSHCGRLPLAIIVLGGVLATKKTIYDWKMVHDNIKLHLKRAKGNEKEQLGVFEVLALSYEDLPIELKPCFLQLSQFLEDYEMSTKKLINIWVAESFVPSMLSEEEAHGESLEDIAYGYLEMLAERYIIQVEKKSSSGRIKSCRMHDLMRELCLSNARKENFSRLIDLEDRNRVMDLFPLTGRIRRLSLSTNGFSTGQFPLIREEDPPCRSILAFCKDKNKGINPKLIESIAKNMMLLRILDLEDLKGFQIPKEIGDLVHLRLLNLRSAWIGKLPSSIGNLDQLMTLILDTTGSAENIPNVFYKMQQLRHLYLPRYCGSKTGKLQFANLSNLMTLVNFPASHAESKDLLTLPNLRKLVVVISDKTSFNRFMNIFKPQKVTFYHLGSLSIFAQQGEFGNVDVELIIACCPHLYKLKLDGRIIHQEPH